MINLASGLIYLDLAENELLTRMIRDTLMPNFSWPTVLMTAQSHGRKGSEGGAGLPGGQANIQVDVNGDPLDFCSAMKQNYTNWNAAIKAEINSLMRNKTFEITFLSLKKIAISCK